MIHPSTIAKEAARLLTAVGLAILVVRGHMWVLQDVPEWVATLYLVGLSVAALAFSSYLRESQVEQDTSDWVDYRDWKRERDG